MDEHAINHQSSNKLPNSQAHNRTLEQNWLSDFQAFSNRLPIMSTIPHSAEMSMVFPPNWQAGSFQFLHPSGVLPYNLNMPTTDRTENVMPTLNHNISFSQAPPQSQNVDQNVNNQPSQQSSKRNVTGVAKVKEHWTVDEDVELCVAWLKISEDPITGTGQKQGKKLLLATSPVKSPEARFSASRVSTSAGPALSQARRASRLSPMNPDRPNRTGPVHLI